MPEIVTFTCNVSINRQEPKFFYGKAVHHTLRHLPFENMVSSEFKRIKLSPKEYDKVDQVALRQRECVSLFPPMGRHRVDL